LASVIELVETRLAPLGGRRGGRDPLCDVDTGLFVDRHHQAVLGRRQAEALHVVDPERELTQNPGSLRRIGQPFTVCGSPPAAEVDVIEDPPRL